MKYTMVGLVVILCLVLTCNVAAHAQTNYYIDAVKGNDSNSGTSINSPWKTFSAIMLRTNQYGPGDSILFKRGSVFGVQELTIYGSGTQGSPITLATYGTGAKPILKNPKDTSSNSGNVIRINGDWVIVDGFDIDSTQYYGVLLSNYYRKGSHNIVRNCEIKHAGGGIGVDGRDNLITKNYIHDLHLTVVDTGFASSGGEGVSLRGSHNEVSWNILDNCSHKSYVVVPGDTLEDGGAVGLFAGNGIPLDSCYIHHNRAYNCNGFTEIGAMNGELISDCVFAYNEYINDRHQLFAWFELTGGAGPDYWPCTMRRVRFENNTIVTLLPTPVFGEGDKILGWAGTMTDTTSVIFRNNIVYSYKYRNIKYGSGMYSSSHNIYYSVNGEPSFNNITLGPGDIIVNPKFATLDILNIGTYDLHLQSNSPAIGAGLSLGYRYDIDSVALSIGTSPAMGAFEHTSTSNGSFYAKPDSLTSVGSVTLYWNVAGAQTVSIDQGIGSVPPIGSRIVTVSTSTDFILTAAGSVEKVARVHLASATDVAGENLPHQFALKQNYPNPFNPSTTIRYSLPRGLRVTLAVFNALGQIIAILVNEKQEAGFHEAKFDGSSLTSGMYFYRLQAETYQETKKLLLIR